jgi:hypothetical protein
MVITLGNAGMDFDESAVELSRHIVQDCEFPRPVPSVDSWDMLAGTLATAVTLLAATVAKELGIWVDAR